MFTSSVVIRCASLFALLSAVGCGGGDGPALAPVKGRVTVGGSEPFARGIVKFFPQPNSNLNMREAVTDDHGNYVMKFSGNQRGLEPGDYLVSFSLFQQEDGSPLPDQTGEAAPKPPSELGVQFVPPEYNSALSDKHPTTVTTAGGSFDFDIPELKAQPKRRWR
jgi:hypothetical protein